MKMATQRQTWALFCATKVDYRDKHLTYDEASKLLAEANALNGYLGKSKPVEKVNKALEIHNKAYLAGKAALDACVPTPMVVVDGREQKEYFVEGGVCGFAWVQFKATTPENRAFLAGLKKAGLAGDINSRAVWNKAYNGGYSFWIGEGGQSMHRKEAFAGAYAEVLRDNGITAHAASRMD